MPYDGCTGPRGLHKIALAALFTVGNALIRFPWRSGGGEMPLLFLLSVAGTLIPAVLIYPLLRRLFRTPLAGHRAKRLLAAAVAVLIGCYALVAAVDCMRDYLSFAFATILPGGGKWLLCLLFLGCAVWLSGVGDRGTDIFALLGFALAVVCTVGLFLFGLPDYRAENLALQKPESLSALLPSLLPLWLETVLPLVLLGAYFALVLPRSGERALVIGTVAGCGLLSVCVLQTLLTFGASLAATYPYPYAWAARTISVGPYFFRLEGFSYLPDYLACLMRSALCLAVARRLLGRFFPRAVRAVRPVLFVTLSIILLFLLVL